MTPTGLIHDVLMDELAHTPHQLTSDECHALARSIMRALRDEYPMQGIHGEWYTTIPIRNVEPAA